MGRLGHLLTFSTGYRRCNNRENRALFVLVSRPPTLDLRTAAAPREPELRSDSASPRPQIPFLNVAHLHLDF